jgi:ParB family chromosome partitioning protein
VTQINAANAKLREILVEQIDRNPENPRIVFRPAELEELLESIRRYGVQVPISVYREGGRFVLIDGERRWRCCLKLNKRHIPALVQDKPTPLTNLLLMFNIHALREQWDLFTVAVKLPRVIDLLEQELGRRPNERELADQTGMPRAVIRRCKLLVDLPDRYKDEIRKELNKPKAQAHKLTEDFFIEMERSLKTVERSIPQVIADKDEVRDVLIEKYRKGTIRNVTDFRDMSKIARAERVEVAESSAQLVLKKLFERNDYSIENAYRDSVSEAYSERSFLSRIRALSDQIDVYSSELQISQEIRESLEALYNKISRILGRNG